MKRRPMIVAASVAAIALIAALTFAAVGTARSDRSLRETVAPPAVPHAKAIKAKYKGQKITWVADNAVGKSHSRDLKLAARFTKDTGIKVNVVPHPAQSDAAYSQLARNFSAKSSRYDVVMMDVVWPGAFAKYLVNLKKPLGKQAKQHASGIVANDTVGGKLIAMPWFGDFGILYYRTDLLRKYHVAVPKTWTALASAAKKIQAGERAHNPSFYGFVYQGNSYEGLTCDSLEWLASSGGGQFFNSKGKVTINNKNAVKMLNMVRGWVGKITPRGVTSYAEEDARTAFDDGNAAFMRNWPYAYAASQAAGSKVAGKFDVTVLPHLGKHKSVGTVGGWQLGVSKFSKHKGAAIELVRYLTSAGVEKFDAIYNSNVPTIPAVAKMGAVRATNPYLKPAIASVQRVTRPSRFLKARYNEGSKIIYQGINRIENGANAKSVLPSIARSLQRLAR